LHDELGFADGLTVVDEHRNLLVHRVGLEEQLALVVVEVLLLDVLVAQALEAERKLHSDHKWARPRAEQLQLLSSSSHSLLCSRKV